MKIAPLPPLQLMLVRSEMLTCNTGGWETVADTVTVQPLASVAVTVIGKLPVCVGVPESVAPVKVKPDGNAPVTLKLTAPMPPECHAGQSKHEPGVGMRSRA